MKRERKGKEVKGECADARTSQNSVKTETESRGQDESGKSKEKHNGEETVIQSFFPSCSC